MLTHYHGQIVNYAEIGKSLQLSDKTIRGYVDLLQNTFMIRVLMPWYENIGKRVVKRPKVYIRDAGILHYLMNIRDKKELMYHPKLGASWEGFAIEEIIKFFNIDREDCYFYSTHQGAECDLVIVKNNEKIGFEFKYTDHPKLTKSMRQTSHDLGLKHQYVVYPINKIFALDKNITAVGLEDIFNRKINIF